GDRGRRVAGAEDVILRLLAGQEAGQSNLRSNAGELLVAASQNLVWLALVADVPDQLVVRCIEYVVQRNRQFHDAKARREMAARPTDHIDHPLTHSGGNRRQLLLREGAKIHGRLNPIQNRHGSSWVIPAAHGAAPRSPEYSYRSRSTANATSPSSSGSSTPAWTTACRAAAAASCAAYRASSSPSRRT